MTPRLEMEAGGRSTYWTRETHSANAWMSPLLCALPLDAVAAPSEVLQMCGADRKKDNVRINKRSDRQGIKIRVGQATICCCKSSNCLLSFS